MVAVAVEPLLKVGATSSTLAMVSVMLDITDEPSAEVAFTYKVRKPPSVSKSRLPRA